MELLYDLKRTALATIAKALLISLCAITIYNLVSFSQSTSQAVDRSFSSNAEKGLYSLVDRLIDPDAFAEFRESSSNVKSLAEFYSQLNVNDSIELISVFDQTIPIVDARGDNSFDYGYGTEMSTRGKYLDEASGKEVMNVKSIQLNQRAFDFYNLEVSSGETIRWNQIDYSNPTTPVLLGADYRGLYAVGDTLEGNFYSKKTIFTVVGFLEPDQSIFYKGDINFYLDSYLVVPYPPSIVDFPQEETYFYGILSFAMINSVIAADSSFSTDDVLDVLLKASQSSGFDQYSLLNVPTYLVQFSLAKRLITENLSLLIYIEVVLVASTLVGVVALNQFTHHRRKGQIRIAWTLGQRRSLLAGTTLTNTAIEYSLVALFSGAVILSLPNQSPESLLPVALLLVVAFVADAASQQRVLTSFLSNTSKENV